MRDDEIISLIHSHDADIRILSSKMEEFSERQSKLAASMESGLSDVKTQITLAISGLEKRIYASSEGKPTLLHWLGGGAAAVAILSGLFAFNYYFSQNQITIAEQAMAIKRMSDQIKYKERILRIECIQMIDSGCRAARAYSVHKKSDHN